jgi:hypothetical protein
MEGAVAAAFIERALGDFGQEAGPVILEPGERLFERRGGPVSVLSRLEAGIEAAAPFPFYRRARLSA